MELIHVLLLCICCSYSAQAQWTFGSITNLSGYNITVDGALLLTDEASILAETRGNATLVIGSSVWTVVFADNLDQTVSVLLPSNASYEAIWDYSEGLPSLSLTINDNLSITGTGLVVPGPACAARGQLVRDNTYCSCYSGFAPESGADCNIRANSSCEFTSVGQLATDAYPELDPANSRFTNNEIQLVVRSPLVENRLNTSITVESATDEACTYPGPNWFKTISDCADTFSSQIPWTKNSVCGFLRDDSDPDFLVYSARLVVTTTDKVGELRGFPVTRVSTSILNVQVKFPKQVQVTSSQQTYSAVNLLAALTETRYEISSTRGRIVYTTSLQWPFILTLPQFTSLPTAITVFTLEETTPDGLCSNTDDSACVQTFTAELNPNGACRLSGAYVLNFTVACRPDQTDCPIDESTNWASIVATITSEDICASTFNNVTLNGELRSYLESSHTTLKDDFLIGQTPYFRASVSSPDSTIVSAVITSISVTAGSTQTVLLNSESNTESGDNVSMSVTNGAQSSIFNFAILDSVFSVLEDQNVQYTVSATLSVTYQSNELRRRGQTTVTPLWKRNAYSSADRTTLASAIALSRPAILPSDSNDYEISASERSFGQNVVGDIINFARFLIVGFAIALTSAKTAVIVVVGSIFSAVSIGSLPGLANNGTERAVPFTSVLTGSVICPAGTYITSAIESGCAVCPAGTFNDAQGSERCIPCAAGTYSEEGAEACVMVPPGYISMDGSPQLLPCPAGTLSSNGERCVPCAPGTSTNRKSGRSSCTPCPAGSHSSADGATCVKCPVDTFTNTEGNAFCQPCPAYSSTHDAVGSTSCSVGCPAGHYLDEEFMECMSCPPMTSTHTEGEKTEYGSCMKCPKGTYSFAGAANCNECPHPRPPTLIGAVCQDAY